MSTNFKQVSIGFKPYFLSLLLKDNLLDIGKASPVDLFDIMCRSRANRLIKLLKSASCSSEILINIKVWISETLARLNPDQRMLNAMHLIYNEKIRSVNTLSHEMNTSASYLRYLFRSNVGPSAKHLIDLCIPSK